MPLPPDTNQPDLWTHAEAAYSFIETEIDGVQVVSAMLNERYDPADNLYACMDVGFKILGRPGVFFVHPHAYSDWPERAVDRINYKLCIINSIYEGLAASPCVQVKAPPPP